MEMSDSSHEGLRELPPVHELLEYLGAKYPDLPHALARRVCRDLLEGERERLLDGGEPLSPEGLLAELEERGRLRSLPSLDHVLNAAGIMLHTAIGRAPLPPRAAEAIQRAARGYCVLQWNRKTGRRGHRDDHIEDLIRELTGAEAATVVNNNAGATLLVLAALARGREVIVSRGQLVEIGGAFRIPEVMKQSGAIMREVGCTNRTHLRDYREAVNENTALLLRVHPSNYRIRGFTGEVAIEDLVALGNEKELPVMDDLGSGSVVDLSRFGLPAEPGIRESIEAGVSVTTSSADKLIGGPQGGIITGRRELIAKIRKHPLARALRVDKLTLAGLEATLRLLLDELEEVVATHPLYAMLAAKDGDLSKKADTLKGLLSLPESCSSEVVRTVSYTGSGSLPDEEIPSWGVSLVCPDAERLAGELRMGSPAVTARIEDDCLILDVRTILEGELELLAELVSSAAVEIWAS
jgi:L-seryl-tRNA(Ser) seleniumtransferase